MNRGETFRERMHQYFRFHFLVSFSIAITNSKCERKVSVTVLRKVSRRKKCIKNYLSKIHSTTKKSDIIYMPSKRIFRCNLIVIYTIVSRWNLIIHYPTKRFGISFVIEQLISDNMGDYSADWYLTFRHYPKITYQHNNSTFFRFSLFHDRQAV